MIRKVLLLIFFLFILLIIIYFPLISYGIKQGIGQLKVVWSSDPIEELLVDPNLPDTLKSRLELVREIVEFGVEEIGLEDKGNYQDYYDQKGNPTLYVVTGAEPYALKPYEWKFPVVGLVPYKGFFDKDDAENEKNRLLDLGYDVDVRSPGGWSTLGWFNDPVLSSMLLRSEGNLANIILHEMTHATVFVKDSVEYNENLASFVGDQATLLFLLDKYGYNSLQWNQYIEEEGDWVKFVDHILGGADKLDSLYKKISSYPEKEKIKMKTILIDEIIENVDTINFHHRKRFKFDRDLLPNNAYFMSFLRYRAKQEDFQHILSKDFNNNLKSFVKYLNEKYD